MDASDGMSVLSLADRADHSWTRHLTPDPETEQRTPNRSSREVKSGHFVTVKPTPLRNPKVVLYSPGMVKNLGMKEEDVLGSKRFAAYFSGDSDVVPGMSTWATPYALSIMGARQTGNCPFGNGNGYGDGRAVSVGEVLGDRSGHDGVITAQNSVTPTQPQRWEMQLKGGGPTPFCRGADGRAVLRSSIREFLASEAMFHLGVDTTRALSLVVSEGGDVVRRPWYDEKKEEKPSPKITMDDPRLAKFPDDVKRQIINQARNQKRDPDVMIVESCAITTRVAPSFTRIGHVDLFARRAESRGPDSEAHLQLAQIVRHAAFREFPELVLEHCGESDGSSSPMEPPDMTSPGMSTGTPHAETICPPLLAADFLRSSGKGIAKMCAGWLRVGFCQGNFNADNCLVAGRTMDYGPFGWMDQYDPFFAKWTGSGEHFAFANQPSAGLANFSVLAQSVSPLLNGGEAEAQSIISEMEDVFEEEVNKVWRVKLGFFEDKKDASKNLKALKLWSKGLEPLLRRNEVDFTVAFRQLSSVILLKDDDDLFDPCKVSFYDQADCGDAEVQRLWVGWLKEWRTAVLDGDSSDENKQQIATRLNAANPKYILREWMLVEAYSAAKLNDDFGPTKALQSVTSRPYEEGSQQEHDKYFNPQNFDKLRKAGGTAFMS